MDAEILQRIQRINAAFGHACRTDLKRFPAKILRSQKGTLMMQDFSGGASDAELANVLQSVIHNLASFCDYLRNWAEPRGISRTSIYNYLSRSPDFCIIMDLYNRDKHGPPNGRRGWSRRSPELGRARGVLQMKTQPKKGSTVCMTAGLRGEPIISGDGSAHVVVTAEVLDKNGNGIGDVDKYVRGALRFCEGALRDFNVCGR